MQGIEGLKLQSAPSGKALNAKFQKTGKFEMGYGKLDVFFGGLELLLGPPLTRADPDKENEQTIMKAMEYEHTHPSFTDTAKPFHCANGTTTTSQLEWEFAYAPDMDKFYQDEYPERRGFREHHPEWLRQPRMLDELRSALKEHANDRLAEQGHSLVIDEELIAARLCTRMPSWNRGHVRSAAPALSVPLSSGASRYRTNVLQVQRGLALQDA